MNWIKMDDWAFRHEERKELKGNKEKEIYSRPKKATQVYRAIKPLGFFNIGKLRLKRKDVKAERIDIALGNLR